jgi:hypothetical protein
MHTGITAKKEKGHKPSLEDMYLIDEPVKLASRVDELKEDLLNGGYDLSEFSEEELERMVESGV